MLLIEVTSYTGARPTQVRTFASLFSLVDPKVGRSMFRRGRRKAYDEVKQQEQGHGQENVALTLDTPMKGRLARGRITRKTFAYDFPLRVQLPNVQGKSSLTFSYAGAKLKITIKEPCRNF